MFSIQTHFQVADLLGHSAFDHLAKACSVHRGVHELNIGDPLMHDWRLGMDYEMRLLQMRRDELQACVQAIVLFQASMEKIPYFVPTLAPGLRPTSATRFNESWTALLDQISDATDRENAKSSFIEYKINFYDVMRNPIIHGRTSDDIEQINLITARRVHAGMRAGWQAYDVLLAQVLPTHEPSWSNICSDHNVPEISDAMLSTDIHALGNKYGSRYLEGLRSLSDTE